MATITCLGLTVTVSGTTRHPHITIVDSGTRARVTLPRGTVVNGARRSVGALVQGAHLEVELEVGVGRAVVTAIADDGDIHGVWYYSRDELREAGHRAHLSAAHILTTDPVKLKPAECKVVDKPPASAHPLVYDMGKGEFSHLSHATFLKLALSSGEKGDPMETTHGTAYAAAMEGNDVAFTREQLGALYASKSWCTSPAAAVGAIKLVDSYVAHHGGRKRARAG